MTPRTITPNREYRTEPIHARVGDSVIVCGSGPSLRGVESSLFDLDVCAVSTAIRYVKAPTYWCFLDPPSPDYGDDRGMGVMEDAFVTKVTKQNHMPNLQHYPSMVFVPRGKPMDDEGRRFMDGHPRYIYGVNQSIIMAVQFLVREGFKTLVFAGCDFNTKPDDPYCYESERYLHRKINMQHTNTVLDLQNQSHGNAVNILRAWTPIAKSNGVRFVSVTPESKINEFMEKL